MNMTAGVEDEMKKCVMVVVLMLVEVVMFGRGMGAAGIEKSILLPVPQENSSLSIRIENVYVFSQDNQPPLVAFYAEDQSRVFVYDTASRVITGFNLEFAASIMSSPTISFITFCWDPVQYSHFAVVFSVNDKNMVFKGNLRGNRRLKGDVLDVNTTDFNYYNGILYYLDLNDGEIHGGTWLGQVGKLKPGQWPKITIADFKIIEGTGEPYVVLRNTITNDNGIYRGWDLKKVVDKPGNDEFYPHYSADGQTLGYIQRDKTTGAARVCLEKAGRAGIVSSYTFALPENARLREYQTMYFVGNTLYYYMKEPDIYAKQMKGGLRVLSANQDDVVQFPESLSVKFVKGETFLDITTGKTGVCEDVRAGSNVKNIIPCRFNQKVYDVIILNNDAFKTKLGNHRGWSTIPAILIMQRYDHEEVL